MTLPMILLQFQNNFVFLKIVMFWLEKLDKLFKIPYLETVLLSIPFDKLPWDQYDTGHSRHYQVVFLTASPLRGPIPTVISLHLSPFYGVAPPGGITWNQSTTITWYFHLFLGYVLLDIFPVFWLLTIFRRMTISKGIACLAGLTVVWYCALLSTHLRARPWYDATLQTIDQEGSWFPNIKEIV